MYFDWSHYLLGLTYSKTVNIDTQTTVNLPLNLRDFYNVVAIDHLLLQEGCSAIIVKQMAPASSTCDNNFSLPANAAPSLVGVVDKYIAFAATCDSELSNCNTLDHTCASTATDMQHALDELGA